MFFIFLTLCFLWVTFYPLFFPFYLFAITVCDNFPHFLNAAFSNYDNSLLSSSSISNAFISVPWFATYLPCLSPPCPHMCIYQWKHSWFWKEHKCRILTYMHSEGLCPKVSIVTFFNTSYILLDAFNLIILRPLYILVWISLVLDIFLFTAIES